VSTKVFISDIHLSDTTTGDHNITLNTLRGFWNDIERDVFDAGGHEKLELVVLGDFIDIIRSTRWKGKMQPWADKKIIKVTVDAIVQDVLEKNKPVFDELKSYKKELGTTLTYVMGNHDRLINSEGYDDIRKKIQVALGHDPTGEKFPWTYPAGDLPIYAAHGNDYDVYNMTINIENPEGDALNPLGDAIVTLLINLYPQKVYDLQNDKNIFEKLQEIDNLRPSSIAPFWIHYVSNERKDLKNILQEQWESLLEVFSGKPFVSKWAEKHWDDYFKLKKGLDCLTSTSMAKLYEKFSGFFNQEDLYAKQAMARISRTCDYVLFGHTHESYAQLLDVRNGKEKYYINTGTWRKRIVPSKYKKGDIVFGSQRSVDYVLFTIDDAKPNEIKEFQLWNGTINA
jgi:UDP-2,3-diacylglucosamine pyrophosphatase LpxH